MALDVVGISFVIEIRRLIKKRRKGFVKRWYRHGCVKFYGNPRMNGANISVGESEVPTPRRKTIVKVFTQKRSEETEEKIMLSALVQ